MKQPKPQDNFENFKISFKYNIINWELFFHLDTDQRASAEQLLQQSNIISSTKKGNYEVKVKISGIVPNSRPPRDELENTKLYFTTEIVAKSLQNFYQSRGQETSITRHKESILTEL